MLCLIQLLQFCCTIQLMYNLCYLQCIIKTSIKYFQKLCVPNTRVSVAFPCDNLDSTTYPLVFSSYPALSMTSDTTVSCSACYHTQSCHQSSRLYHSNPALVMKCQ